LSLEADSVAVPVAGMLILSLEGGQGRWKLAEVAGAGGDLSSVIGAL
jgi:hypothetical protein